MEGLHVSGLSLINTSISDAAFDELSDVSASWVDLQRNHLGNDGLAGLTAIPPMQKNLVGLELYSTQVTDDGLRHLATCPRLSSLSLGQCAISNDGLKTIVESAPQLQLLNLVGTEISDEGLAHLVKAANLADLRIKDTKVTQTGVDLLKSKLPRCAVSWDDPTGEE